MIIKKCVFVLVFLLFILSSITPTNSISIDKKNIKNSRKIDIDTAVVHFIHNDASVEWLISDTDTISIEKGSYPVSIKWDITCHVKQKKYQFEFTNIAKINNLRKTEASYSRESDDVEGIEGWYYVLDVYSIFLRSDARKTIPVEIICKVKNLTNNRVYTFSKTFNVKIGDKKTKSETIIDQKLLELQNSFNKIIRFLIYLQNQYLKL